MRLATVIGVAVALVGITVAPAQAHGSSPDASNFLSSVLGTAQMVDGAPAGEVDGPPGVTWRVLGADALLQVENTGTDDLVVAGYAGEPYLRVGPRGVFENVRSPATHLNADRYAVAQVPPEADPEAAPDWRKVSDTQRWQWHDHRIHWMAPTRPPQVQRRPGVTQTVLEWHVPFDAAGEDLAVQGVLRWIPPGPAWPWLAGAALIMSLLVLLSAMRTGGHRRAVRVSVVAIAVVAVAAVVVAIGDVAATPASGIANMWAVVQTVVPAALAVALAASLWRDKPAASESGSLGSLLIPAAILAIGCGLPRASEVVSSQIVNALPPVFVRAAVAASLVAIVPAALTMLISTRARRQTQEATPVSDPAEAR